MSHKYGKLKRINRYINNGGDVETKKSELMKLKVAHLKEIEGIDYQRDMFLVWYGAWGEYVRERAGAETTEGERKEQLNSHIAQIEQLLA